MRFWFANILQICQFVEPGRNTVWATVMSKTAANRDASDGSPATHIGPMIALKHTRRMWVSKNIQNPCHLQVKNCLVRSQNFESVQDVLT